MVLAATASQFHSGSMNSHCAQLHVPLDRCFFSLVLFFWFSCNPSVRCACPVLHSESSQIGVLDSAGRIVVCAQLRQSDKFFLVHRVHVLYCQQSGPIGICRANWTGIAAPSAHGFHMSQDAFLAAPSPCRASECLQFQPRVQCASVDSIPFRFFFWSPFQNHTMFCDVIWSTSWVGLLQCFQIVCTISKCSLWGLYRDGHMCVHFVCWTFMIPATHGRFFSDAFPTNFMV